MMKSHFALLAGVGLISTILTAFARAIDADPRSGAANVLECDVAIMGGGAAGTYAAFRLRDEGKKVVVIERKTHLVSACEPVYFLSS
jgi:heterodisulfide reductase subunit A-like polyferredoxin